MTNNTTWFEVFLALGAGIILIALAAGLLALTNPKVEAKCQAAGGQVLVSPGHVSSCLYPAKIQ
jgi:hypothetical protein